MSKYKIVLYHKKNNCVLNTKETCLQKHCNQDLEPLLIKLLDIR